MTAGRRSRKKTLALALALVVSGTTVLLALSGPGELSAHVVGGNVPVNASAVDQLDVTGHNSPKVVVNPTDSANLAVANRIDTPRFSCALHVSFDGGATWAETPVPAVNARGLPCFSPDLAFDASGRLHLSFTSFSAAGAPEAVWVAASDDGGRSLTTPTRAAGELAFQVRLGADPVAPGRLYLTWLQATDTLSWGLAQPGNPIVVSRSDDGGLSWNEPRRVSSPERGRAVAPAITVGHNGRISVAFLDVVNDRLDYEGYHEGQGGPAHPGPWSLVMVQSTDGGRTWGETVVDAAIVPTQRFLMLFPPTPSLVDDPERDRLYVGFHDARLGDADVWVWASDDSGVRWGPPRRVGDAGSEGTSQYLPALDVAHNGRLDVVYYDRRSDPNDVLNEVTLSSSLDGARTFMPGIRLSERAFDSRIGFGADRDMPELGNRLGLLSTDAGALAVWADTRGNVRLTAKQDLARALVAFSGEPLRTPLRYAGAFLVVGGMVVALMAFRADRRREAADDSEELQPEEPTVTTAP